MKLKLIFPYRKWKDVSNKYSITIYRNKIHNYIGLHPLRTSISISEQHNSEKFINSTFYIYKLDKLDRKKLNTKATHKIVSQELHNIVQGCDPYCVKLNWFQEFYINWFHKKYIIQSKEIKTDIIKYLIGGILGFIGTIAVQKISQYNRAPENPPKQEIKKSLDQKYDQITDKTLKTDSIINKFNN